MYTHLIKETFRGSQIVSLFDELYSKRVILFTQEVNHETAENLIAQLLCLDITAKGKPITLLINSPGGDVTSGLAVVDVINSLQSPVHTVCIGIAASMGAVLFLQGQTRTALNHSRFMLHDPSFGGGDMTGVKPLNMQESLERLFKTREELAEIIADKTGHSIEDIYEKTQKDYYLSAQEALEFGIATNIGDFSIDPQIKEEKGNYHEQKNYRTGYYPE